MLFTSVVVVVVVAVFIFNLIFPVSRFDKKFEGWDCGEITTCGSLGKICGGYNVKGTGSDIKKTYRLPSGTYAVELDFIRIDSWFVCPLWRAFAGYYRAWV